MKIYKNLILPTSLVAGTIIGAGVFALPFLFQKSGLLTGFFYLIFFGCAFALIHLMYADVILRTEEKHRFVGYADLYLGRRGKWLSIFMTIFGMIFSLTAYLVLSASFINLLLSSGFAVPETPDIYKIAVFWFFGSAAIFLMINSLAVSELLITSSVVFIIFVIFGYGINNFGQTANLPYFNPLNIFLPYGAILFSFAGRTSIPAVLGYFRNNNQSPVKAKIPIIAGTTLPAFIYILFILGILGTSEIVSEDSVSGLKGILPLWILGLLGIFGTITLWSTYIVIARDIKKSLQYDLKLSGVIASLIVVILPILLYTAGFQNFLGLVGLVGGVFISLEGILIVLMWLKASKIKSEEIMLTKINPIITKLLLIIFLGGVIYELVF